MTAQAMSQMFEKAMADETFTKGLVEAVGDKKGDQAIAAVTEYGTANGFSITAEDVVVMQQKLISSTDGSDGDLDDADLENVAGGFGGFFFGPPKRKDDPRSSWPTWGLK